MLRAPAARSAERKAANVEHKEVRRILPGRGSGPVTSSDLERLPPRAPLGQSPGGESTAKPASGPSAATPEIGSSTSPADAAERKQTLLYHPIADAAGVLDVAKHHITLAGIEPVGKDETCSKSDGGTWPCGLVARTAFRSWLRGRALTCDVPAAPGSVTASCTVGSDDPALWLAENGWAKSSDPRYRDAARKAREEKRGMFGDPPKAYSSMPALPAPEPLPAAGDDMTGQVR